MKIETNTIYTIKLITGEELVTKIKSMTDQHYVVDYPITTMVSPQGLQMVPSLFSADLSQEVCINISSIAMISHTREDVSNSWIEATTGIKPVTKQIITG